MALVEGTVPHKEYRNREWSPGWLVGMLTTQNAKVFNGGKMRWKWQNGNTAHNVMMRATNGKNGNTAHNAGEHDNKQTGIQSGLKSPGFVL